LVACIFVSGSAAEPPLCALAFCSADARMFGNDARHCRVTLDNAPQPTGPRDYRPVSQSVRETRPAPSPLQYSLNAIAALNDAPAGI